MPVPRINSFDELNVILEQSCLEYLSHNIEGKPSSVEEMFQQERMSLRALPGI